MNAWSLLSSASSPLSSLSPLVFFLVPLVIVFFFNITFLGIRIELEIYKALALLFDFDFTTLVNYYLFIFTCEILTVRLWLVTVKDRLFLFWGFAT